MRNKLVSWRREIHFHGTTNIFAPQWESKKPKEKKGPAGAGRQSMAKSDHTADLTGKDLKKSPDLLGSPYCT